MSRVSAMQDPTELKEQSARLRYVLLRILEPLFILIASLLLLTIIPYFPYSLSVILSLVIAVIAFKVRSAAVLLMFALAMPGYIYQGGFSALMLGVVSGTLFIVAMTCIGAPGTALGVATGTVAAMLMFTPAYFLAIPLLIGVALFRTKGIKVGVTEAILVFLAFYLPFLVPWNEVIDPSAGVVPLFGQVDFASKSPASVVELSQIIDQMKDSLNSNPHIMDNMAIYWPIEGTGRLLGFVLLSILIASIFIAFGALSLVDWFRERVEERKYVNWFAPMFALLIANMAFLIPIFVLKSAFIYKVAMGPAALFGFLVATIFIGNAGSAVEHWLNRHERLIDLRFRLENLMDEVGDMETRLREHIGRVKTICPSIDLFAEKFVVEKCQQELAFILANLEAMDPATMNDKLNLLSNLKGEISDALHQVSGKLLVYIDDSRHDYRQLMSQATEFGFAFDGRDFQVTFSKQHFVDDDSAMDEQQSLNQRFEELAQIMVSSGTEISRMVKEEVDPEFINISMDIAQSLFDSGNYPEAIEASLGSMSTAKRMVEDATADLASELDAAIKRLQETIRISIVPAIELTNDPELASNFNAEFVKLEKLRLPAQPGRKLIDRLQVVKATRELFDWTGLVIEQLFAKINALEEEIDSMVSSGYSWGKSEFVPPDARNIVTSRNERAGKSMLDASMEAIEITIRTIEEEASIIRHHMAVREFVINYPNIEYLLEEKLNLHGVARLEEVPVKQGYAMRYFQLFAQRHYQDVIFDSRSGVLSYREK